MFSYLLLFVLSVRLSAGLTQFSPHPAVTKLTKLSPQFSPSAKLHWYFPEYGFGDYANLTRVYTCRHTGEPNKWVYGYQLALTVKPEFAKIYFSADISNVPEGQACVQVCAAFDDGLEKCSAPFLFDNSNTNKGHQPSMSFPVFWNQDKRFDSYPYLLRISPAGSQTSVEWYFPRYNTYTFTTTVIYTCQFNPSDLSIFDLRYLTEYETEHNNVHGRLIPQLPHRWLCVSVCVVSWYQLCGKVARYDDQAIHGSHLFTTTSPTTPSVEIATTQKEDDEVKDVRNSNVIFDDYEDLESLLEEPGPGLTSLREDVSIAGANATASAAHKSFPDNLFFSCLLLLVLLSL